MLGMFVMGEKNYDTMRLHPTLGFHKIPHLPPSDEKVKVRTGRRGPKSRADREAEAAAAAALAAAKADPKRTAGPDGIVRQWPTLVALNKRARAILTVLSRRWKKQMINEAKKAKRAELTSSKPVKSNAPKPKFKEGAWSKVEKTKFYRAVRVFGMPAHLAPAGLPGFPSASPVELPFPWDQFSLHAELKRSPQALNDTAESFIKRCAWLAATSNQEHEMDTSMEAGTEMWADSLTTIQARQARSKIGQFIRLRKILAMPDLHDSLQLIPLELTIGGLPPLPYWWKPGRDDIALLRGIDKWGTQYAEMAKDGSLDVFKNIPSKPPAKPAPITATTTPTNDNNDPSTPSTSTGGEGGVTSLSSVPTEVVTSAPAAVMDSSVAAPTGPTSVDTSEDTTSTTVPVPVPVSAPVPVGDAVTESSASSISGDVEMAQPIQSSSTTIVAPPLGDHNNHNNNGTIDLTNEPSSSSSSVPTLSVSTSSSTSSASKEKKGSVIPSAKVLDARFEFLLDFLEDPDSLPILISKSESKSKKKGGASEGKDGKKRARGGKSTPGGSVGIGGVVGMGGGGAAGGRAGTPAGGEMSEQDMEGDDVSVGIVGGAAAEHTVIEPLEEDDDFMPEHGTQLTQHI
jgi:hypothetical protein